MKYISDNLTNREAYALFNSLNDRRIMALLDVEDLLYELLKQKCKETKKLELLEKPYYIQGYISSNRLSELKEILQGE